MVLVGHEAASSIGLATAYFLALETRIKARRDQTAIDADGRKLAAELVLASYRFTAACQSFRRRFPRDPAASLVEQCLEGATKVVQSSFDGDATAYGNELRDLRIALVDALELLAAPRPIGLASR